MLESETEDFSDEDIEKMLEPIIVKGRLKKITL